MNLQKGLIKTLAISIFASALLVGCGGGSGSSSSSTISGDSLGVVSDPYIENARFYVDVNGNTTYDDGEPLSSLSDENGAFTFEPALDNGTKIIMDSNNRGLHQGEDYTGPLLKGEMIDGSLVATPLTTMVANGFEPAEIVSILSAAGIEIEEADIFEDPMAAFVGDTPATASDFPALQAAVAVNTFLTMLDSVEGGVTPENISSYTDEIKAAADLITGAINPNSIEDGADPLTIVKIGTTISNYVVKQKIADSNYDITEAPVESLVEQLAPLYEDESNEGRFFPIEEVGEDGEVSVEITSTEIEAFGTTFEEVRKDEPRYKVQTEDGFNNSQLVDGKIVVTAFKRYDEEADSYAGQSRAEAQTLFDTRQSSISADMMLVQEVNEIGVTNKEGAYLTGWMNNFFGKDIGLYVQIGIKANKVNLYASKEYDSGYYPDNYNGIINESFSDIDLDKLSEGVNATISVLDSGKLNFKVTAQDGTDLVNEDLRPYDEDSVRSSIAFNYGFTSAKLRANSYYSSMEEYESGVDYTQAIFSDFSSTEMTESTITKFIDPMEGLLLPLTKDGWLDKLEIEGTSGEIVMFDWVDTYWSFTGEEEFTAAISDDKLTVTFDNGTVEDCTITKTRDLFALGAKDSNGNSIPEDTIQNLMRCEVITEGTGDKDTWDWENHGATTITELETLFTSSNSYFGEYQKFMLASDGKVVQADYVGTTAYSYVRTNQVVGTWSSDENGINVDLSDKYKVKYIFSLEEGKIVEETMTEVGYVNKNILMIGDGSFELYGISNDDESEESDIQTQVTNLISGKKIYLTTESMIMSFYSDGNYAESGVDDTDGDPYAYSCTGKWAVEDMHGTIGITCDEDNGTTNEPTFTNNGILAGTEIQVDLGEASSLGSNDEIQISFSDDGTTIEIDTLTISSIEDL